MSNARGFTVSVTKAGATIYTRGWTAKQWEIARDDYFLSLRQNLLGSNRHLDRVEDKGTRALPYSCESGGVLVKIERTRHGH